MPAASRKVASIGRRSPTCRATSREAASDSPGSRTEASARACSARTRGWAARGGAGRGRAGRGGGCCSPAPPQTQSRWKVRFGAHWIVWTDGSLWPRHSPPSGPRSWMPDTARPADETDRRRVAAEAAPVYAHLHNGNSDSVGIELAHSGRAGDPFPAAQVRSLAWLLRSLLDLSGGRLTAADIHGHKDLDRRPAYVRASCERPGCPYFVDGQGRALRRRVDPPESLFAALSREGIAVPRPF